MDDVVYERTKEQRDHWKEQAELLAAQIQRIRDLPTYSVSQSVCIDPYAEKLLKADAVYKIIGPSMVPKKGTTE